MVHSVKIGFQLNILIENLLKFLLHFNILAGQIPETFFKFRRFLKPVHSFCSTLDRQQIQSRNRRHRSLDASLAFKSSIPSCTPMPISIVDPCGMSLLEPYLRLQALYLTVHAINDSKSILEFLLKLFILHYDIVNTSAGG